MPTERRLPGPVVGGQGMHLIEKPTEAPNHLVARPFEAHDPNLRLGLNRVLDIREIERRHVADQRLPEMSGLEILAQTRARSPLTAGIILTAYPTGSLAAHVARGEVRCLLAKPWHDGDLRRTIRTLLREFELTTRK